MRSSGQGQSSVQGGEGRKKNEETSAVVRKPGRSQGLYITVTAWNATMVKLGAAEGANTKRLVWQEEQQRRVNGNAQESVGGRARGRVGWRARQGGRKARRAGQWEEQGNA